MACRDVSKAHKAAEDIRQTTGVTDSLVIRKLNLASLASVREFAKETLEEEDRLDILINNAGK